MSEEREKFFENYFRCCPYYSLDNKYVEVCWDCENKTSCLEVKIKDLEN